MIYSMTSDPHSHYGLVEPALLARAPNDCQFFSTTPMDLIKNTISAITPLDSRAEKQASARLDHLTKPIGSLGRLEEIVKQYAAMRGDPDARMGGGALLVFVADHGVADAGVSAYPQAVTLEMLRNLGAGGAAISVLARRFNYQLIVTDVGVATDTSTNPFPGVRYRRIAAGTRNFLDEPAMTHAQAINAIAVGIKTAHETITAGATILGIGEMGIANSTSAAALIAAATGIAPARIVGRGTGLSEDGLHRKIEVVERALARHHPSLGNGLAILAALGGFEIAAMAGVCFSAASLRTPVVIDGFIATAASIIAEKIAPDARNYMFFSHRSAEGGHALALDSMRGRPLLDLDMRLGEGTGAAIAMNLIETALTLFHQMATFESASVSGKIA
jgi:nicotinate-nucleotide--dimethylbenzimidazole phosphoribosyltransferase